MFIKGKVTFYGLAKKEEFKKGQFVKTNEDVVKLAIKPESLDGELDEYIKKTYEDEGLTCPKWLREYRDTKKFPSIVSFTTSVEYKPTIVYDENNERRDINEFELYEAEIIMKINKSYIGAIKVLKNGHSFCPFS